MIPRVPCLLLLLVCCGYGSVFGDDTALSEFTYRELSSIDQLIDQRRFQHAMASLNQLLPQLEPQSYDQAVALQMLGHIHSALGNPPAAVKGFRQALRTGKLSTSRL